MISNTRSQERRKARRALLQVLYEADASGHALDDSLQFVLGLACLSEEGNEFVRQLAHQVAAHGKELDKEIELHAPSWPVAQLPTVDRNILRLAIFEVRLGIETPPKVAINEAVELAKRFGSEGSRPFVNGVLGAVMAAAPSG